MAGISPAKPALITTAAAPGPRLFGAGGYGAITSKPQFNRRVAHPARVYGYWLGGKDNYRADRTAAEEVGQRPQVVTGARANHAFLGRVVRYLAGQRGIRQFVDIGRGLPAPGSMLEVAQADPAGIVAKLAARLAPGSGIAISHLTADFAPEQVRAGVAAYNSLVPAPITARSHARVTGLFGELSLVAPGVVPVAEWRPDAARWPSHPADLHAGLAIVTGRSR